MTATKTTARPQGVPTQPTSLVTTPRSAMPTCRVCGTGHLTELAMTLTDGTPVTFRSCHRCEHRSWFQAGVELSRESVLAKARKNV